MEMKIIWTESAIDNLRNIHFYYKIKANIDVAKKIVNNIEDKTHILEKTPRIGQEEELLKYLKMKLDIS